jgi:hypothetical protein
MISLQQLRSYILSDKCDKWELFTKVKNINQLIKFIEDESQHLQEIDLKEYAKYVISVTEKER